MSRITYQSPAFPRPPLPEQRERIGLLEGALAAIELEWGASWGVKDLFAPKFEFDPLWIPDAADIRSLRVGLDEDLWDFSEARSLRHAYFLRERKLELQENRRKLETLGWRGPALRIGAAIFDPADIAAGFAASLVAGPAGATAAAVTKADRLRRMARYGVIGSASAIPVQAYISSQSEEQDEMDVMYAAVGGFIGGGAAGVWSRLDAPARNFLKDMEFHDFISQPLARLRRNPNAPPDSAMGAAAASELSRIDLDEIASHPLMTDFGRRYFRKQLDPERAREVAEMTIKQLGVDPVEDAPMYRALRESMERYASGRRETAPRPANMDDEGARVFIESRFTKKDLRSTVKSFLPEPSVSRRQTDPTATQRALADDFARYDHADMTPDDHVKRLLARTFVMDKDGDLPAKLSAVSTDQLTQGDTFWIGRANAIVLGFDDAGHLQIHLYAPERTERIELPMPGGETFVSERVVDEAIDEWYVLPRSADVTIPFNPGSQYVVPFNDDVRPLAVDIEEAAPTPGGSGGGDGGDTPDVPPPPDGGDGGDTPDVPPPPDGGMDAPIRRPPKQFGDLDLSWVTAARPLWARFRFSLAARLGMSPSPTTVRLSNGGVDDALPKADGSASGMSASAWADVEYQRRFGPFAQRLRAAYREWAKEHGRRWSLEGYREFREMVARASRVPAETWPDPSIQKARQAVKELQADLVALGKRHGVKGFDAFEADDLYLTRIWSPRKVQTMAGLGVNPATGRLWVEDLLFGALKSRVPDLPDDIADRIARGAVRNIIRSEGADAFRLTAVFSGYLPDALEQIMRDAGIDDAQIQDVLYGVRRMIDDRERNVIPRARHRMRLDETFGIEGPNGIRLTIEDLLDNDIERLMSIYTNQIVGAAAATEWYKLARTSPDDVVENFSQLETRVRREYADAGIHKTRADRDIALLSIIDKKIRRVPINDNRQSYQVLRILRQMAAVTVNQTFGIAQIPEIANIIGTEHFRSMLRQLPALRRIYSRAADGTLANETVREMAQITGLSLDRWARRYTDPDLVRRETAARMTQDFPGRIQNALDRIESVTERLEAASYYTNGMMHINQALQAASGLIAEQKWYDVAVSGKIPNDRRLLAMGLTKEQGERIADAIRAERGRAIRVEPGPHGERVVSLNLEQWEDMQAATMLRDAIVKWSHTAIHQNNIGNLAPWMTNPWVQTFTQFRSFMIGAYEKQLLSRIYTRDLDAFATASLSMLIAGSFYVLQQYSISLGRPDADEFRAERLNPRSIALAAFQRSGWSSIIPTIMDQAQAATGGDPLFNYRYSGLTTRPIDLNSAPAVSFLNNALFGIGGAAGSVVRPDQRFSEEDARRLQRIIPFQNAIAVKNILDQIVGLAPEDE